MSDNTGLRRLGLPSLAGVYDSLRGGKDNYKADRDLASRLWDLCETLPRTLDLGTMFVREAVDDLLNEGIRQFVDIGTGLPRRPYLHPRILERDPHARVVYLDCDPVVNAHLRALVVDDEQVACVAADVTDTVALASHHSLGGWLDLKQPVAALCESVLEFIPTADAVVNGLGEMLAPGSALVISQLTTEIGAGIEPLRHVYDSAGIPFCPRGVAELTTMLRGCTLGDPGIASVHDWVYRTELACGELPNLPAAEQPGCYGVVARWT